MSLDFRRTPVGNSPLDDWGDFIDRVRRQNKLGVKEMAARLGVTTKAYQKWVYEHGKPSAETYQRAIGQFDEVFRRALQQAGRASDPRFNLFDEMMERWQQIKRGDV